MKKFLFMKPVLTYFGQGRMFTSVVAAVLRVFAVLICLAALVTWIKTWETVFGMVGAAVLGGLLFQMLFLIGIYMIVHTCWIRAEDIQVLQKSAFTVIRIVSILLRMAGEIYASVSIILGTACGAALFFGGHIIVYRTLCSFPALVPFHSTIFSLLDPTSIDFATGGLILLAGTLSAIFWLFLFYLASEMILVLASIAHNTGALLKIAEQRTSAETADDTKTDTSTGAEE